MRILEADLGGEANDKAMRIENAAVLARLRAGDHDAFEQLVRENSARLLAVARLMLRNEDDARDALQDAFLSAFRSIRDYRGTAAVSTWLHRIVVNAALMRMRSRRRRPEQSLDDVLRSVEVSGAGAESVAEQQQRPDTLLERAEARAFVCDCIDRLPESYRTAIVLRDIEGLETRSVARRLGVTSNAVKIRVHRARRALRTLLDPYVAAAA
ncbi:MAG: RNA polymerase sigma factor [bacterium]